jgi:hypothetical protein
VKKQKNSTVEEEGYIEYYCKDCDYSYTEVLEKLPKQEVTDISLSTNNLAMEDSGATDQLTYVISPEDATNQMVTWVSSDENVVTVDETGVITAVAVGQAAIVVQTEDGGYLDVCEIVVGTPEEYSLGEDEYDNEEADEDSTTQEPNGEISEEPTTQEPNGEISEEPTTQEPNGEISEEPTTQEPNGEISEEPTTQEPNGEISEEPTTQNPNGEVSENSTTKPDAIENPESKVDVADIKKDRGEEDLDNSSSGTTTNATENKISKNDEVLNGNLRYKVISQSSTKREVVCTGIESTKIKKVVIPTTITIEGTVYKVTSIENGAFKNNKKITSIVIGKNVTSIGKEAFKGCSKLKTITVKSTKIKKVGRNALKGIEKNATIKVPKKKKTAYKKLLKGKGQKKSVKIK